MRDTIIRRKIRNAYNKICATPTLEYIVAFIVVMAFAGLVLDHFDMILK